MNGFTETQENVSQRFADLAPLHHIAQPFISASKNHIGKFLIL
jgi:hypothetical protein